MYTFRHRVSYKGHLFLSTFTVTNVVQFFRVNDKIFSHNPFFVCFSMNESVFSFFLDSCKQSGAYDICQEAECLHNLPYMRTIQWIEFLCDGVSILAMFWLVKTRKLQKLAAIVNPNVKASSFSNNFCCNCIFSSLYLPESFSISWVFSSLCSCTFI